MAKITAQTLKDAGFIPEMFGLVTATFDAFLTGVITEQAAILSGRIGAAIYGSSATPTADYVKRGEKALCLVELWDRRITRKLGQTKGEDISIDAELKARDKAAEEANFYIVRLDSVSGGDYAGEVIETEHDQTLGGYEASA
jgi:hypothetical protein